MSFGKEQVISENAELQKENALLKVQFDEACQVASQFQELHAKYQETVAKLRDVEDEKEDLNHRLEICVQNNRELAKQVADLAKSKTNQMETEAQSCHSKIERMSRYNDQRVEALTSEIDKLTKEKMQVELRQKELANLIERAMQSATRYFRKPVASLNDLIGLLDKAETRPVVEAQVYDSGNENKLRKKIKKMKVKIAEDQREKLEMESAVQSAQANAQESQRLAERRIAELESAMAELNHKLAVKKAAKKQLDIKYEEKVRELKVANEKLQEQVVVETKQAPVVIEKPVVVEASRDKLIRKLERKHNEAEAQLCVVVEQLKAEQVKKEEAIKQLQASKENAGQLGVQIEKLKGDAVALNAVIKEMQKENENMRIALETATRLPEEPKEPVKPRIDVQARVKKMERELEQKETVIMSLRSQVTMQQHKIDSQAAQIREDKYSKEQLTEEVAELRTALSESRVIEEERRKVKPEPTITDNAFICENLDPAVAVIIRKIAMNATYEPDSKVHACFHALCEYYKELMHAMESDMENVCETHRALSNSMNQFLIDMTIALSDKPITLERFLKHNSGEQIIKAIKELRTNCENAKRERDSVNDIITHLVEIFPEAKCDPITVIDDLKREIEYNACKLAKKAKETKIAKCEAAKIAEVLKEVKEEYEMKRRELNAKVDEITGHLSIAEKEALALKVEKKSLLSELGELRKARDVLEQQIVDRESEKLRILTEQTNARIAALTVELEQSKDKCYALSKKIRCGEKAIARLSAVNDSLEAQMSSLQDENVELKNMLTLTEKRLNSQSETEKDEIRNSYERAIAQLREQCQKHRLDMQKIVQSRKEVEEVLNATEVEYANVTRINDKLNRQLKNMSDVMEREKKLIETAGVAKQIAAQREFECRLNELRVKADADKKRVWNYCAENLRVFFDPHETINERSIKRVIDKVKQELERLTALDSAIRQIAHAREGQSTQDAVARLLVH